MSSSAPMNTCHGKFNLQYRRTVVMNSISEDLEHIDLDVGCCSINF